MKKSKLITMALSFLLTIGMVSAGFAAWVISAPTVKEATGTVKVDTVTDKRIKLSINTDDGKKLPVVFGAKTEGITPNNWLSLTDDAQQEDLVSEFSFTIDNQQDLFKAGVTTIKLDFSIDTSEFTNYSEYIATPDKPLVTVASDSSESTSVQVSTADKNEKITVTVKYSFDWGTKFGSMNPYEYFSSKTDPNEKVAEDSSEVWADYAVSALEKIEELKDKTFKITITATVVENTQGQ